MTQLVFVLVAVAAMAVVTLWSEAWARRKRHD